MYLPLLIYQINKNGTLHNVTFQSLSNDYNTFISCQKINNRKFATAINVCF